MFIAAILTKSYPEVKISIKYELIALFILIATICYALFTIY